MCTVSSVTAEPVVPERRRSRRRGNVRDSYVRLTQSKWFGLFNARSVVQATISWWIGKPLPDEEPVWILTPLEYLYMTFSCLTASTLGLAFFLDHVQEEPLFVAPIVYAFFILVGSLRSLQVTHGHYSVHGNGSYTESKRLDSWIAELTTLIAFAAPPIDYKNDHVTRHHKNAFFATELDPDNGFALLIGIRPNVPVRENMRKLLLATFNPKLHLEILKTRLVANFLAAGDYGADWNRRLASLIYVTSIVLGTTYFPICGLFYVLALTWGYQVSAMLQVITEHVWFQTASANSMQDVSELCVGRFCGDPLPNSDASVSDWLVFFIRLAFIHIPTRLAVFVGDMPQHDAHHLLPASSKALENDFSTWGVRRNASWTFAHIVRERMIQRGDAFDLQSREIYGLDDALLRAFRQFATPHNS